jgi:PAS domain S-box-containing protein
MRYDNDRAEIGFYKSILDNIPEGVYVLDRDGNYLFVNSAYVQMFDMSKAQLLNYNTHQFLSSGQVDFCVSDITLKEKRKVIVFQDVLSVQDYVRTPFRHLVIVSPVFNESGEIQHMVGVAKKLEQYDQEFTEASRTVISSLSPAPNTAGRSDAVIGESPAMRAVFDAVKTVSGIDAAVLISGESGTGKEVIARHIHNSGNRRGQKMVTINCASLPENLLEAELFGYEKGAFTGASANGKVGLFEIADKGTLFLDEINSLPLNLQGKLLRAIETKTIQRIGSTKTIEVDFRLIAATNENLKNLVEHKEFRIDLYYRLNVIPITIPPLRQRQEDILPLANYFLKQFCEKYDKQKCFSQQMTTYMQAYHWPGNVRELRNFVERSVVMSVGNVMNTPNFAITQAAEDSSGVRGEYTRLPRAASAKGAAESWRDHMEKSFSERVSLKDFVEQCESAYIELAARTASSTYELAELLGTSQASIMRKKKKYRM